MEQIPFEKFAPAEGVKTDSLPQEKPKGYFRDALGRFLQNKSSVAAAVILLLLFLFAMVGPLFSGYSLSSRDGYYKWMPPMFLANRTVTVSQASYDYHLAIGAELGESAVKSAKKLGNGQYAITVNAYEKVGFVYLDLSPAAFDALRSYEQTENIQICFPLPEHYKTTFLAVPGSANLWYKLADSSGNSNGRAAEHTETGEPILEPAYLLDEAGQPVYAVRNQTGYRCRVLYSRYYAYTQGHEVIHFFGTNQHGQDIFVSLAYGARLSFLLAIGVSLINFFIGIGYGCLEGFYGGKTDLILERIADILASVPFIVVATLFQLHLAQQAGPILSLLFAFVLTGWIGIAGRVRTQFYRFKNAEYVLAARTLGARDRRLIFRHILPNSLGTIITGTILIIPGVIFSESMLSYLGIVNFEAENLTSIGTMLGSGRQYLGSYPHIIAFPAVFLALLEISFNLFGNGLRDAFDPSLRGAE